MPQDDPPSTTNALVPAASQQLAVREVRNLRVRPYQKAAAGLTGVLVSAQYAVERAGALKGLKLLLDVNQAGGFDCPGCAWPEPGRETRSRSSSARTARRRSPRRRRPRASTPELLRARTRSTSSRQQSDYWLGQQGRLTRADGAAPRQPALRADRLGRRVRADRRRAARAPVAGRGGVLHVRAHVQRGRVPVPALRPAVRHEQPARLLEHVPRVERRRAVARSIGVGKGTVTLDDFEHADADPRHRPEPRHEPPAHADRRCARRRSAARRSSAINPLREVGLVALRAPAEVRSTCSAGDARSRRYFLQVRIGGDLALPQGRHARRCSTTRRASPAAVLDRRVHRASTPTGFDALRARRCDATPLGRDRRARAASRASHDPRSRRDLRRDAERDHRVLGDGPHAAQARASRTIQEIVNLLLLRGNIGRPGAGLCPVRGHSQRAGRPHDGHLASSRAAAFLDALGAAFGFDAAARARPRHRRRDRGDATTARSTVFVALGGNFLSATPDTERTARGARALPRSRSHVSTKLNRSHLVTGRDGADPAVPRPHRARRAGGRPQFVTVEDSMSMVHALAGRAGAGVAAPAAASPRSSRALARGAARRARAVPWARARRRLRPHPRPHRARSCPASRTSTRACASRAASSCRTPRASARSRPRPARRASPSRRCPSSRSPPGQLLHDDDPQPRPVQHDDLRPRRSLPRHPRRAPRGAS